MKSYIVYITHYTGELLPEWYIGSSYKEKIDNGYNGTITSKEYKEIYEKEQKYNKNLFKTRILSYWGTREEAYKEELRLQIKHKVVNNQKYINKAYANEGFGKDNEGENNPMFGRNHTQETKQIISEKNKLNKSKRALKQKRTIANRDKETQLMINKKISDSKKLLSEDDKKKIVSKFKENISSIEENGKTKAQNMARKGVETKKMVQENGKTIHQNAALKAAKTKKENGSMEGLSHPKCKKVLIYNDKNEIIFISDKAFKSFCIDNNIPFSIFNKSKQRNSIIENVKKKEHEKYIGWRAEYQN